MIHPVTRGVIAVVLSIVTLLGAFVVSTLVVLATGDSVTIPGFVQTVADEAPGLTTSQLSPWGLAWATAIAVLLYLVLPNRQWPLRRGGGRRHGGSRADESSGHESAKA